MTAPQTPDGAEEPGFLEVESLLALSLPRTRSSMRWFGAGVLMLAMLMLIWGIGLVNGRGIGASDSMAGAASILFILILVLLGFTATHIARAQRREQAQLEAIEEFLQLRRWKEAAGGLQDLLSKPTLTHRNRIQALVYLATVLTRYERFADAITVQEYLLKHVRLDANSDHGLRVARAMAMLREHRLFDVDSVIGGLRRQLDSSRRASDRQREEAEEAEDAADPAQGSPVALQPIDSAGFSLVEMYRDIITGHPAEALEIFDAELPAMRKQFGIRIGDVYGLAAKAYDLLGRTEEARRAYLRATLLVSPVELVRRYPELAEVQAKYPPAPWPTSAAGGPAMISQVNAA